MQTQKTITNEVDNTINIYLCKTCGHNVAFPIVLHSKGNLTDGAHDIVYIATAQDRTDFDAYYYTHQALFTV